MPDVRKLMEDFEVTYTITADRKLVASISGQLQNLPIDPIDYIPTLWERVAELEKQLQDHEATVSYAIDLQKRLAEALNPAAHQQ